MRFFNQKEFGFYWFLALLQGSQVFLETVSGVQMNPQDQSSKRAGEAIEGAPCKKARGPIIEIPQTASSSSGNVGYGENVAYSTGLNLPVPFPDGAAYSTGINPVPFQADESVSLVPNLASAGRRLGWSAALVVASVFGQAIVNYTGVGIGGLGICPPLEITTPNYLKDHFTGRVYREADLVTTQGYVTDGLWRITEMYCIDRKCTFGSVANQMKFIHATNCDMKVHPHGKEVPVYYETLKDWTFQIRNRWNLGSFYDLGHLYNAEFQCLPINGISVTCTAARAVRAEYTLFNETSGLGQLKIVLTRLDGDQAPVEVLEKEGLTIDHSQSYEFQDFNGMPARLLKYKKTNSAAVARRWALVDEELQPGHNCYE